MTMEYRANRHSSNRAYRLPSDLARGLGVRRRQNGSPVKSAERHFPGHTIENVIMRRSICLRRWYIAAAIAKRSLAGELRL